MTRKTLAVAAIAAALLAAVAGSPAPGTEAARDAAALARAIANEEDHVTALELARWIRDRRPRLRIVDLRPAADFQEFRIPRAERIALEDLPARRFAADESIVLISGGGTHAGQAWVLLRAAGHRDVWFLRGGMAEWLDDVMHPPQPDELTRYFGGTVRMGDEESADDVGAAVKTLRRRGC